MKNVSSVEKWCAGSAVKYELFLVDMKIKNREYLN